METSDADDRKQAGDDVELADVRLLNQEVDPDTGQANSWYSANGRGYTVNGSHNETPGGISHVATVLGEAFYAKERRNQRAWDFVTSWPHPAFNSASVVLLACVVILLALLLFQTPRSPISDQTVRLEDATTPEERLRRDAGLSFDYRGIPRSIRADHGAVAADHGRCSDIGADVLRDGGNALDAIIAAALCQGVTNPGASGIGGGAFILIRLPNGTAAAVDARETAPAGASEAMFKGNASASMYGGLAVAVPLELKGLWLAYNQYGGAALWSRLVEPAAQLARDGFPAHPYLVGKIREARDRLEQSPELRKVFLKLDGGSWRAPRVNETCCARPQLAKLLSKVASGGLDALYNTGTAEELAAEIRGAGGIITAADLLGAQPIIKEVITSQVFGMEIVAPPPPSSAAALISALHIMEGYATPLQFTGLLGSHRIVESLKSAFALRTHLADPGNCSDPAAATCFLNNLTATVDSWLLPQFATSLRDGLRDNGTQDVSAYGGAWRADTALEDDHGTSHLSAVDKDRMAVSMTTTINRGFGSYVYSKSTGILLNDQMDDFSTPGQSNGYGLAPSKANFVRPGKKPLSSMSPVILSAPGGQLRAVLGASGGPRIISAIFVTLLRIIAQGQSPLLALSEPRLHHQLLPDELYVEQYNTTWAAFAVPSSTEQSLQSRGHNITSTIWGGVCQVIAVDPDTSALVAASDPRKDGAPAGY